MTVVPPYTGGTSRGSGDGKGLLSGLVEMLFGSGKNNKQKPDLPSDELMIDFLEKIDLQALSAAIEVVAKNKDIQLDLIGLKFKKSKRKLEIFVDVPEKSNKVKLKQDIYQQYQAEVENRESNGTINYFFINIDNKKLLVTQNSGENMTNVNQYGPGDNIAGDGDTYNIGQAGAVGRYARSDNNTFVQTEQRKTLAEAAAEIQKLLKQLEQSNPAATDSDKIAYVNDETTPSFKRRVVGALQAGGEAAIEEFFDNPYVNVGKAVVKGWIKPE